MVASNTPGFGSQQGSQQMPMPQQQQFGGYFGSSTDYNNPFGNAKTNPLNAPVQPQLGVGPAANNNNNGNNVPSVFNSIWSSEPTDKKYVLARIIYHRKWILTVEHVIGNGL